MERSSIEETVLPLRWFASPWWPYVVLGLGFLLRLFHLGYQSIWYDEGVSLYLARQSVGQLIQHTAGDIHPPLYYLLLHFWLGLAGDSEFAAAFVSVFWGLLLVALLYWAGCRLYDRAVGGAAALLVAVSTYQIWYSQEIRMYTLGALLGWVAFCSAWEYLERQELGGELSVRHGAVYVVACALGLYALYYFAFLLIAFNVWAVLRFLRLRTQPPPRASHLRSSVIGWSVAQLAVVVLYLPWLGIAFRQVVNPPVPPWRSLPNLWVAIIQSWSALSFGQTVKPDEMALALLLTFGLFVLGIGLTLRRQVNLGLGLALYTLCPLGIMLLVSLWMPLFHERYVFIYSAAFYLAMAVGLVWLMRRWTVLGCLAGLIWLGISGYSFYEFHYDPKYAGDDFRSAVTWLAQAVRPGDAILINAGYAYPPFVYYYPYEVDWRGRLVNYKPDSFPITGTVVLQTGSIDGNPTLGWGREDSDFYATNEDETAGALSRVFAAAPRVWMLRAYDTVVDPGGFVRAWLDTHGRLVEDRSFAGDSYLRVQGYLTQPEPSFAPPPLSKEMNVTFDNDLELLGYVGQPNSLQAGRPWEIDLYWKALRQLPADYRVAVQWVDQQGQPWARDDQMPLGTAYPTSHWLNGEVLRQPVGIRPPQGIPAGNYRVEVLVYDPRKQQALGAVGPDGRTLGDRVALGEISLSR